MSEPKASLLPANSSPLEKAQDLGFGHLLDRVTLPFPQLMNPGLTPALFLPYLAADRAVNEWSTTAPEAEKRLTVKLAWPTARQAGTHSLSGKLLPEVTLSVTQDNRPGDQAFITATFDEKSRSTYMGSRAAWWDAAAGKQRMVDVGVAPFKTLRQRYQNEAEARAVAQSELRRVGREGLKMHIDCPGNPLLAAEGLLRLDESWPSYIQGRWSMKQVVHVGDPATGYRSTITATGLSI